MERQRIVISGLGGQGVLTLTRLLAEAALGRGLDVITSETHGMAQRGGTVISMVKAGPFRGPLIAAGTADLGLFLHARNLAVHRHFLRAGAPVFINAPGSGEGEVDASGVAARLGTQVAANLVLAAFAAQAGALFCDPGEMEEVLRRITPERHLALNLAAFAAGRDEARKRGL